MTRQRLRESVLTELAEPCPYCDGSGYLKSKDTISYEIIREIRHKAGKPGVTAVEVHAGSRIIDKLREFEQEGLKRLEKESGVRISFRSVEGRLGKYEVKAS